MSNKLGRIGLNENKLKWPLKKSKSCGPFWSYQLNSTANSADSPQKWADLAVLFSWLLQNGIHLSLFSLRPMRPNLLDIINFSEAV